MSGPQPGPELTVVRSSDTKGDAKQDDANTHEAVPAADGSHAPAPAVPSAPVRDSRGLGTRLPIWVLGIVLLLTAAVALHQFWRAEALESHVFSLETNLARIGAELAAYQGHLQSVRSVVGDLSERMGSLTSLVNRDPLSPEVEVPGTGDAPEAEPTPGGVIDAGEATP